MLLHLDYSYCDVIRVLLPRENYLPLFKFDPATNISSGFYVELMKKIFEVENLNYTIEYSPKYSGSYTGIGEFIHFIW